MMAISRALITVPKGPWWTNLLVLGAIAVAAVGTLSFAGGAAVGGGVAAAVGRRRRRKEEEQRDARRRQRPRDTHDTPREERGEADEQPPTEGE